MMYKNKIKVLKQTDTATQGFSTEKYQFMLYIELYIIDAIHQNSAWPFWHFVCPLAAWSRGEKQVDMTWVVAASVMFEQKGLLAMSSCHYSAYAALKRNAETVFSLKIMCFLTVFTWWNSTKANTKSMITSVTHITEHHFFFMVGLSTYNACLTFHTLPWVGLNHRNKLHAHIQARRMA